MQSGASKGIGFLLAYDWIDGKGNRSVRTPDALPRISWPSALKRSGQAQVIVTVASGSAPVAVEIRSVKGQLDRIGRPGTEPITVECVKDGALSTKSTCRYKMTSSTIVIEWLPSVGATHAIVSARWYVPVADRGTSKVIAKSANWNFSIS